MDPVEKSHAHDHDAHSCHCCPDNARHRDLNFSRRSFLTTAAVGGAALTNLMWSEMTSAAPAIPMPATRKPIKAKPVLVWDHAKPVAMRSWRGWGGIHTPEAAAEEVRRIEGELKKIRSDADFPLEIGSVRSVNHVNQLQDDPEVAAADVILFYGAGHSINGIQNFGKDVIIFQRHRSGPLYLQYEIVSPRFLRQHTDQLALDNISFEDVVTDDVDQITWRLRALCGLKNTLGTKILCIGGPGAWSQPEGVVPALVEKVWRMQLPTVGYDELGKVIEEARNDEATMKLARQRADAYLATPGTSLETKRQFVDNCFLLDHVFRNLMAEADCHAITVLGCMGTIMPKAQTSACLTLSLLNDDGYLAFCESDFVVIPSGVLLGNISGQPPFLNDPTYPHDGVITLAHCTGPRRMNGKRLEPARIVTHFESDFGAAPKVEMPRGQLLTNIAPDFKSERWMGLRGKIVDAPFLPICRDQIDVAYDVPDATVAERMPGFHWMTVYGDYSKEVGYALRRVGIQWDDLDATT